MRGDGGSRFEFDIGWTDDRECNLREFTKSNISLIST